jgi:hypothetical protein
VKLPAAAALAFAAFAFRRFRMPIQISIRCDLGSVPAPAGAGTTDTGKSASMPASTLRWKPVTSNFFPEITVNYRHGELGFLINHAGCCCASPHDPGMRLRDIAARLDITERSAHGIITDLTAAGYLVKQEDGRRNRYQIQAHLPLPEPASRERTVGEVLALLTGNDRPGIQNS